MSEVELVFRRAERQCSESLFWMLLFKKLLLIQIFNQYLLNKKDDTCPLLDTNISAWIELSQGVKGVMKLGLDVKIRIHARLSNTSYMRLHSWTEEGCAAANFSHYILMTETKTSSAKNQRIHYMIKKYFHAPWNFQMNILVSLWFLFCFVLFSFGTSLWPHVFIKNTRQAFIHMTKKKTV